MRVLIVCSGNYPDPVINFPIYQAFIDDQMAAIENQHAVSFDVFLIEGKGLLGYLKNVRPLIRVLKENKYDVLHAHYGLTAIICLFAKRNEKLVVSFMGDDLLGSRKTTGRITKTSVFLSFVNTILAKRFYDHSIVKSEQMLKRLGGVYVSLIPNGVDTSLFIPKDKKKCREKLKLDSNIKLVVFLSNPRRVEKNYPLVEIAVKSCGISNIHLLSLYDMEQNSLVDYYNAADVLSLGSFHEGSPNVIKEAMACNCPIVSTDVGDVRWVIGETAGCYIARFEPEDFAEKLKKAIEFAQNFVHTSGRSRILGLDLDSESIAKKIVKVYRSVITNNN